MQVMESALDEYQKELQGLTLGMYIDISMYIRVGGGDWNTITQAKEPVKIVIGIPRALQADGRKYYIIRAHGGEYTLLDDTDDTPDTITISTDLFSSYAIAYRQMTDGTDAEKCGLCHICPTFLGICYFIWLVVIIVMILIVILVVLRRRKEEKPES